MNVECILPLTTAPHPDENINGYFRRLCALNGVQNLALFRKALGVSKLSSTTSDVQSWTKLAEAALQPLSLLAAMQWQKRDAGALLGLLNFRGFAVQKKYLRTSRLRVCPQCIRSGEIIRDTWSLFHVTACTIHATELVDSCDQCCVAPGEATPLKYSSATRPWNCHCGRHLGEIVTRPARPEALLVSTAIEQSLKPDISEGSPYPALNEEIACLPPNDLLTFVDIIGTAATSNSDEDIPINSRTACYQNGVIDRSADLHTYKRRVHAAGEIMTNWPDSYQKLLSEIAFRNPAPLQQQIDRRAFATKIGAMVLFPRKSVSGVPLKILQKQVDEYCASTLKIIRRKRNLATQNPCALRVQRIANMSALARQLDLNSTGSVFQKAYRRSIEELSSSEQGVETDQLAAALRASVVKQLEQCMDTISSTAAAVMLEGGALNRQLCGWDDPALLQPISASMNYFKKRKVSYRLSDVLSIRDRFIALAIRSEAIASLCEIPRAARMFLTEKFNKTDLLVDLLQNRIALYKVGHPEHVFDLFVDANEIETYLTRRDLALVLQHEKFLKLSDLNRLSLKLIDNLQPFTPADMKRLRCAGTLRFQKSEVYDGQRYHSSYVYSAGDFIENVLKPNFGE